MPIRHRLINNWLLGINFSAPTRRGWWRSSSPTFASERQRSERLHQLQSQQWRLDRRFVCRRLPQVGMYEEKTRRIAQKEPIVFPVWVGPLFLALPHGIYSESVCPFRCIKNQELKQSIGVPHAVCIPRVHSSGEERTIPPKFLIP